jgi:hypothetical protein
MKPSLYLTLMIVLTISCVAQESETAEVPSVDTTSAPATLTGQSVRPGLLTDIESPNNVSGGISISQLFTDNAGLTSSDHVSDLSYIIQPTITLKHFTPRFSYDLGVLAGFVVNRTFSERNQATQSAAFDLSYGLAQFVTLRVSDTFTNSTGLWAGAGTSANIDTGVGIGPVQQGNSSLITYGSFRMNNVLAELSGQLNPISFAGIRATHSYTWFPSATTDPVLGTLYGGNVYSAEAFYNHQFTLRNWGGIIARTQRFDIGRSVGNTGTESLLFLYAFNFRPNVSLSFFGGPELSTTAVAQGVSVPVVPFPRRMWSPAAGAVFSGHGRTMGGTASFTRLINGGGGLSSAVTLDSADAEVFRQFGRFQLGPGFTYSLSTPIVTSSALRTYSGRLQLTYHVGNVALSGAYGRDNRTVVDSNASASANNIWVSFSYGFFKPLGR